MSLGSKICLPLFGDLEYRDTWIKEKHDSEKLNLRLKPEYDYEYLQKKRAWIEDEICEELGIKNGVFYLHAGELWLRKLKRIRIKHLCFMRIEWLKFINYVPARIKRKSLGFVPSLSWVCERRK